MRDSMKGAVAYFMNGPKKGEISFIENAGMPIVVQTMNPTPLKVITEDTLIGIDDLLKITRYTYYPVAKFVNAKGVATWNYSCYDVPKSSKPQTPKRKYKILRRPKCEAQLK